MKKGHSHCSEILLNTDSERCSSHLFLRGKIVVLAIMISYDGKSETIVDNITWESNVRRAKERKKYM